MALNFGRVVLHDKHIKDLAMTVINDKTYGSAQLDQTKLKFGWLDLVGLGQPRAKILKSTSTKLGLGFGLQLTE